METRHIDQVRTLGNVIAGGTLLETIGAGCAIGLTIIGLAQLAPYFVVSLAAIALGASLMLESGFMMAGYSTAVSTNPPEFAEAEFGGGMGLRAVAGLAVVVLGILAALGISPGILTAVSAIVLGGALIFSSGLASDVRWVREEVAEGEERPIEGALRVGLSATAGMQMLAGLAAIVLGIVALAGYASVVLNLVALLSVGGAILFTGMTIGARMVLLSSRARHASQ